MHIKRNMGKKTGTNLFDITMGSYDGAEACELVGTLLLHSITAKYGNTFGLYRDDGLGVIRGSARNTEKIKQGLCTLFHTHGLRITIEANKKVVNFLDVTLDLNNNQHKPYNKPNNTPIYVHAKSNHPTSILRNIPISINNRLSNISSNSQVFNASTQLHQNALNQSGHKHKLEYEPASLHHPTRTNRKRKIIWFNPPYNKAVDTKIGNLFFQYLDEEFPINNKLHKLFNRNTVKLSYSCCPNIKTIINNHNKKSLNSPVDNQQMCNCRNPNQCPLDNKCLTKSLIYQATVTTDNHRPPATYIGLTENTFKIRFNNHTASFQHPQKRTNTELSKYIWNLKESNIRYTINWKVIKRAKSFNPATKRCNLCLWEKYYILCRRNMSTLNRRNELISTCRHATKYMLGNIT